MTASKYKAERPLTMSGSLKRKRTDEHKKCKRR